MRYDFSEKGRKEFYRNLDDKVENIKNFKFVDLSLKCAELVRCIDEIKLYEKGREEYLKAIEAIKDLKIDNYLREKVDKKMYGDLREDTKAMQKRIKGLEDRFRK